MQIITWQNNEILRKKSKDLDSFQEAKKIEKILRETLKSTATWVWLSAPQIWLNQRIFIAMFDRKRITTIVNPKIIKCSTKKDIAQEWCLSLPWIWWDVERYSVIQVEYFSTKWEKIMKNLNWFAAKVFQHEYDHLNWILFIDKAIGELKID